DTLLVVLSDHGFTSWRRTFSLNTWLKEAGYLAVADGHVDWPHSRAYGLGLNGLYINLAGRERDGTVAPSDPDALGRELSDELLRIVDPADQRPAITKIQRREQYRGQLDVGPDLVIGYAKGVRSSNPSALGQVEPGVWSDNSDAWSGDHCMDPDAVPGILLVNRTLKRAPAKLEDVAP